MATNLTFLQRWAEETQRLIGRPFVAKLEPLTDEVSFRQRCTVCGVVIDATYPGYVIADLESPGSRFLEKLGKRIRHDYLMHRCPSATSALLGYTYDEMHEHQEELIREAERLMTRADEIAHILKDAR